MSVFILRLSCPDRAGIVHAVTGFLLAQGGNILSSAQHGDADHQRFFMRIEIGYPDGAAERALLSGADRRDLLATLAPCLNAAELLELQAAVQKVHVAPALLDYVQALVAHTRSQTQPWLRTNVKDRWRALRESLDEDDRSLLLLRVDRKLEWKDIARVMLGDESDEAALLRETERLKKRFQLLKEDLRRRAREVGLIDDD